MERKIYLGADPEIFVEHANGKLFNAFEFLPDKFHPLMTKEEGQKFYWDGFQAEFNIVPSPDVTECLRSIRYGLKAILDEARKSDSGAKLSLSTVVSTPLDVLKSLPEKYVEFGCTPSYNLYQVKGLGLDGANVPHRFAGGHIHFGINHLGVRAKTIEKIVANLDNILAVTCVSLFEEHDNPIRRQYYGLVGEYRLPPHGMEYRTLSNAWMFHPLIADTVLKLAHLIAQTIIDGKEFEWKTSTSEVIEVVLTSNVEKARAILKRNHFTEFNGINLLKPFTKSMTMNSISDNWRLYAGK